jgi:hypothetical protein
MELLAEFHLRNKLNLLIPSYLIPFSNFPLLPARAIAFILLFTTGISNIFRNSVWCLRK